MPTRPLLPRGAVLALLLTVAVGVLATSQPAGAAAARRSASSDAGPAYQPPVDGAVRDPFRPPSTPYGPGNRGLEYDTTGGEAVRAIGPGVVAFAGPVAGRGVVSVVHPDGLRSSLTGLGRVLVRRGERVATGTVVGTALPMLHLGVRRDGEYVDPASLFGRRVRPRRAILVPGRAKRSAVRPPPSPVMPEPSP